MRITLYRVAPQAPKAWMSEKKEKSQIDFKTDFFKRTNEFQIWLIKKKKKKFENLDTKG